MSTITKERVAEFIKKPLDNGLTRGEQMELARIALASLEAEAVAWLLSGGGAKNNVSFDSGNAYADPLREVTPLYTAPPAPVSVPAAMEMDDDFDSAFEHGKAVGWNACRAAMLQGADGNSPVIPDGSKEALSDAVAAIYFNDSSDYFSALWSVVRALSPETAELLVNNEKAAFDATRLPAAPQQEVK